MICLVTIHGIGFQQPPSDDGTDPGYADRLHDNIRLVLGDDLGNDPKRLPQKGPVYVQSNWPPFDGPVEPGLERLGTWTDRGRQSLTVGEMNLAAGDSRFAHVALIYSGLEEKSGDLPALINMGELAFHALAHYASVSRLVRMAMIDLGALLHHQPGPGAGSPSLSPRRDRPSDPTAGNGVLDVIKQIESDVGGYVVRNELRERVRWFVTEALARICARPDVEAVVVNAHSNGTVVAVDALRRLDPVLFTRVSALVTAGSPLRKYLSLFSWGSDCGQLASVPRWLNYWDDADPVADPIDRGGAWRRGDPADGPAEEHLFVGVGATSSVPPEVQISPKVIEDKQIDNLKQSSGGGLQAHNYWDNKEEFAKPLAELLREVSQKDMVQTAT